MASPMYLRLPSMYLMMPTGISASWVSLMLMHAKGGGQVLGGGESGGQGFGIGLARAGEGVQNDMS